MDVIRAIELLDSAGIIRANKVQGDYYSIYCPVHSNGHETHPSCGVLIRDKYMNGQRYPASWVHCFTCGVNKQLYEVVEDISKSKPISSDLRLQLEQLLDVGIHIDEDKIIAPGVMKTLEAKYALKSIRAKLNKEESFISEEELAKYRYTVPYMFERKLTYDMIDKYDVGVDLHFVPYGAKKEVPCITFPVRDTKGRTIMIVRRAIEIKRFYIPSEIEKPVYGIYELPLNCQSVVICESCLNAITSTMYGRPAVALLGTGTPHQMNILRKLGIRQFICGFDPDEAGRKATNRVKRYLHDCSMICEFQGIPEGKDINDLSKEEFDNLEIA